MTAYLYENAQTAIVTGTGTVTLEANQSCWHNQLIISRGTATAGTLTIKYKVGGKVFAMKDQYGVAVTMALTADPEPIRFDGLIDAVIIEQSGNNGTFDALLLGSQ